MRHNNTMLVQCPETKHYFYIECKMKGLDLYIRKHNSKGQPLFDQYGRPIWEPARKDKQ